MQAYLDLVRERFEQDSYSSHLGIVLSELSETTVQMHMRVRAGMNNWFGQLHGGAVYALADAAFSVLANNGNNLSVALDCSISYHASPPAGALLVVSGECLSLTRKTGAYLFKVYHETDEDLALIATMKSVSYRTGKPIDPTLTRQPIIL